MATYIVKSGDYLNKIARENGLTLEQLLALNPGKWPNPNLIHPGDVVNLPDPTPTTAPAPTTTTPPPPPAPVPAPTSDPIYRANPLPATTPAQQPTPTAGTGPTVTQVAQQMFDEWVAEEQARREAEFRAVQGSAIKTVLQRYGLQGLESWAESAVEGGLSAAEIELSLYEQDAFRNRFPAIFELERMNEGLPLQDRLPTISPEDYLNLEVAYSQIYARAGLEGLYNADSVTALITGLVSPAELSRRFADGYSRVNTAAPEVRAFFEDMFGLSGDRALAAYFADAENIEEELIDAVETAEIGGRAVIAGLNIGVSGASRLQQLGVTPGQAASGFATINSQASLFRETVSEFDDFVAELEGVNAQFNLDSGESRAMLLRRARERKAAVSGGGGAFLSTSLTGFGSAG